MIFRNKPVAAREFMETAGIFHEVGEDPTTARINRLADYNAECQRGIVHTEGWDIFMRQEREWFAKTAHEMFPNGRRRG